MAENVAVAIAGHRVAVGETTRLGTEDLVPAVTDVSDIQHVLFSPTSLISVPAEGKMESQVIFLLRRHAEDDRLGIDIAIWAQESGIDEQGVACSQHAICTMDVAKDVELRPYPGDNVE